MAHPTLAQPTEATPLWHAYRCWRAAGGPLADFVSPTPFLAAWKSEPAAPRHPGASYLAAALRQRAHGAHPADGRHPAPSSTVAVFLDAPPRLGLATATHLVAAGWAVAPLLARWPHQHAVLPSASLARWLLAAPTPRRPIEASGPAHCEQDRGLEEPGTGGHPVALCLLLDAERNRRTSGRVLSRRFDNRYAYGAYMLPPAHRLQALGIQRALFVGAAAAPAPDLQDYAEQLATGGLTIELVSLAGVAHLQGAAP